VPEQHRFTAMVTPTPAQVDADDHVAHYGRLHPRHHRLQLGYDWEVRDVTSGQTIATGREDDEEDAEDAAARAKERAEDADAARVLVELGGRQE
jgi:acyl-CoA reductase-like NAD-dependent aldehyde dehydrogenase